MLAWGKKRQPEHPAREEGKAASGSSLRWGQWYKCKPQEGAGTGAKLLLVLCCPQAPEDWIDKPGAFAGGSVSYIKSKSQQICC